MNKLNVASLSASKKLVDNGIVLETDAVWVKWYFDGSILSDRNPYEWRLQYKALTQTDFESIPAPCFTEVWRELPWVIDNYGLISMNKVDNITCCGYRKGMAIREPKFESEKPTDALIDLLVWLKGEGK